MSYSVFLVHLPPDNDRHKVFLDILEQRADAPKDPGPLDLVTEQAKRRLAEALMERDPDLELFQRDYANIARIRSIDESEARRLFRDLELNDHQNHIQVILFDDAAGLSVSLSGSPQGCAETLRVFWSCLEVLESQGGFSTYDTQIDKVLDLKSDFAAVVEFACGMTASTLT
jgi:hypothetical protein